MNQNLLSLTVSDADLTAIDGALTTLEEKLAGMIDLTPDQRRSLVKMGDKSEAFCRQAITVASQNPDVLPANFDLTEAQSDLGNIDKLRPRFTRIRQLLERSDDSEIALGSDVMVAALEAYALLKIAGRGAGLDELRQQMGSRFARGPRQPTPTPPTPPT